MKSLKFVPAESNINLTIPDFMDWGARAQHLGLSLSYYIQGNQTRYMLWRFQDAGIEMEDLSWAEVMQVIVQREADEYPDSSPTTGRLILRR